MMSSVPFKPTPAQLLAAKNKTIHDLTRPGLRVLFVGINPGLYTAAIGRHFGRPGNRFWPALHAGGFTPRVFSPFESDDLLAMDLGITNIVKRATVRADELSLEEVRAGGLRLERQLRKLKPTVAAYLGIGAFRQAANRPDAVIGLQLEGFGGVPAWVLPNPSGLNAHYKPADLARLFGELKVWADANHRLRG